MSDVNGSKKLVRTRDGRIIAGVCSGIGAHFGIDPNLVRLAFGLVTVFTAVVGGVALYLGAWVVIPEEDEPASIAEKMMKKSFNG